MELTTPHPLHGTRLYCVERRDNQTDTGVADTNCFLGSSVASCVDWMKRNPDFEPERDPSKVWWWAVINLNVDIDILDLSHPDYELNGYLHSVYDWDGNLLPEQPGC